MMRMVLLALLAMALPAQAEECFAGLPKRVTFDSGKTITIIQRHGEDVTYTSPYVGGNDVVSKTHLILFPRQTRLASRFLEYRWDSRLPGLDDLVPGYHYDVSGTMKSGDDTPRDYRIVGDVLGVDVVKLGKCSYPVLAIASKSFVGGAEVVATTVYLSTDMVVVLRTEGVDAAGKRYDYKAVTLE